MTKIGEILGWLWPVANEIKNWNFVGVNLFSLSIVLSRAIGSPQQCQDVSLFLIAQNSIFMHLQNQQLLLLMNTNSKLIVALLLVFSALMFPACENGSKDSGDKTENTPPLPPDPNTVFTNFENLFSVKEAPFEIPYNFIPYGGAIADEVKVNFLPREGNIYPGWRFKLRDGYRGFITFDAADLESQFIFSVNVFDAKNKFVESRQVAGQDGAQLIDAAFSEDGSWTETRREMAEDSSEPVGDGIVETYSIDANGKIVQK
jgi:hypothetical protein